MEIKRTIYYEKQDVLNRTAQSLKPVMEGAASIINATSRVKEPLQSMPTFISSSLAPSVVADLQAKRFIDPGNTANLVEAAKLIGNWLFGPRTIRSFQELKFSLLCWEFDRHELAGAMFPNEQLVFEDRLAEVTGMNESVEILFETAARLKIWQRDRIKAERRIITNLEEIRIVNMLPEQLWFRMENDKPEDAPRAVIHESLRELQASIADWRQPTFTRPYSPRLGLIIGDFRVGLHPGHHEMMEHAKLAIGRGGRLIVVTPSKKTIENVYKKTPVWENDIRVPLIANDRYVNDVLLADMPEEYWSDPDSYWVKIWRAIMPDLIFLGEVNHPLEPKYRAISAKLGVLLLIDDSIRSNIRSGDLLAVL